MNNKRRVSFLSLWVFWKIPTGFDGREAQCIYIVMNLFDQFDEIYSVKNE